MRKYATLIIAVAFMLLDVMSSCSWAYMYSTINALTDECYVGGKERTLATFIAMPANGTNYVFEMVNLPPGCTFKQIDNQPSASIVGVPTKDGVYSFTVKVSATFRKMDYDKYGKLYYGYTRDEGSTMFNLVIFPAKEQGNGNGTGGGSSGGGGCNLGMNFLCFALLGAFIIIRKK